MKAPAEPESVRAAVIDCFRERGVALFGCAPAARLDNEAPGRRPADLLPGARSVIGFALPVPEGVSAAPRHRIESIWRTQNLLYRKLDTIALEVAGVIEERGSRALPGFGCCPMDVNDQGEAAGHVNQIRIGESVGLGFTGRNGLLVNSRHGSRLMLGSVVTAADLGEYASAPPGQEGCPEGCRACAEACPVRAISIEGKKVDIMKCLFHTARIPSFPAIRFLFWRRISPARASALLNRFAFDEHTLHVCSRCVSACPLGGGGPS